VLDPSGEDPKKQIMVGFAWLALRQAQEALRNGRLEEAHRLLCQPAAHGHKKSGELLVQVALKYVERGKQHLLHEDPAAAWNDLVTVEQMGIKATAVLDLRRTLTRRGLDEARTLLEAGEPNRALDILTQLKSRSVEQSDLAILEDAAKSWVLAKEQAGRGELGPALVTMERVRRLLPGRVDAAEQFVINLENSRHKFSDMLIALHQAAERKEWREVLRLSEQVLAVAPQHAEAKKARARAWKAVEPVTIAHAPSQKEKETEKDSRSTAKPEKRFLLWIDGVGGYLVCLSQRVTLGQATPDTYVDVPVYADVSRMHAALTRDAEGYLLEATRPVLVNGKLVEKTLLQSGDRVTLGSSCQFQFRQPVPVSTSARLDLVSGHRLPLTVNGVLLMADTLVLGPGSNVHVSMPDLEQPIVIFRNKENLGIRYAGNLTIDGQRQKEKGELTPTSTVTGDDFSLALEPVGTAAGRM
jgi:hypothetical protein